MVDGMTEEKKEWPNLSLQEIAERTMKAIDLHEKSWIPPTQDRMGGDYSKTDRQCFEEAFEGHPLGALCYYANHWTNDLQEWCGEHLPPT